MAIIVEILKVFRTHQWSKQISSVRIELRAINLNTDNEATLLTLSGGHIVARNYD